MPTVSVFNPTTGRIERSLLAPGDPMPYNTGGTLTVREFSGGNDPVFTDVTTLSAFDRLRRIFGAPIRISVALLSADGQEGYGKPQHFAGTAYLLTPLSGTADDLVAAAKQCGCFSVAEKRGTAVYADCRYLPYPPRITSGYPNTSRGSANHYVFFLQQALRAAGHDPGAIDGIFGPATERAVRAFQNRTYLPEDGIVSRREWESLAAIAELP